ncbi:MAG: PIG-L domain-containing protein [Bosea sp. 32-68-6]|nr:MAG: PIG-L domain-containing protein [Bosea sp. 32-68-6]
MSSLPKTGLVITAHPGDFVWRAGGAIALHAKRGFRMKILCLSYGERGESQFAWKKAGVRIEEVKAQRRDEAERAAAVLGAEIEFMDAGDYPLRTTEAMLDRAIDIFHELNPSFVLTHALDDPYNVDHPEATRFAQEARIIAQAAGHKPDPERVYAEGSLRFYGKENAEKRGVTNVILKIDEVWEVKRKAFEILAAQKHLWEYYTRVALNRGVQGGRNSGKAMTYGEAYQRLFPEALETLA